MSDKNGELNLELLNQKIWDLHRSVESATALIGGLLIMILTELILQRLTKSRCSSTLHSSINNFAVGLGVMIFAT